MPPKRGQKRGSVTRGRAKTVNNSTRAASQPEELVEEAKPTTFSPAEQQETLEVGSKRSEPDRSAVDLQGSLEKRQKLAEELQAVEKQIYDLETRYLENSHPLGNALKGYEGLLTQSQASTRRTLVRQEDRLFSNSSVTGAPH